MFLKATVKSELRNVEVVAMRKVGVVSEECKFRYCTATGNESPKQILITV